MSTAIPDMMQAAHYATVGSEAGRIEVERVATPRPGRGEVLVAVAISAINPTDWKARYAPPTVDAPWVIPNQDGAGVIVAVGEGVREDRVGERVWLWQAQWGRVFGTAAQYTALPSGQAVGLPDAASFDLGAELGIPAMTAHRCLFMDGALGPGDRVLVQGGAGAVGHAAIELAAGAGARVAATVSSAEKGELASAAGAELVIDYRRESVASRVREWAPDGVARVIEVDLGRNLETDTAVLAADGAIAVYARTEEPVQPTMELMHANARIQFVLVYTMPDEAKQAAVEAIGVALGRGILTGLPRKRFPLPETAAAHEEVRAGTSGRVLIDVATL